MHFGIRAFGPFSWFPFGGVIMMFIGLLLIGIVLYLLLRHNGVSDSSYRSGKGDSLTPLEILQQRFAEGAISEEEYKSRKKTLGL